MFSPSRDAQHDSVQTRSESSAEGRPCHAASDSSAWPVFPWRGTGGTLCPSGTRRCGAAGFSRSCRSIFEKCTLAAGGISPERLLACGESALRAAGLSTRKAEYVRALSRAVLAGEVNFRAFRKLDDEAVIKSLVSVRGIGRWTAGNVSDFFSRACRCASLGDQGLNNAVRELYGEDARIADFREIWSPFCSVACWYLWASRDNSPDKI